MFDFFGDNLELRDIFNKRSMAKLMSKVDELYELDDEHRSGLGHLKKEMVNLIERKTGPIKS